MIKKIYSRLDFILLILLITCYAGLDTLKAQDRLWGMTSGGGTKSQGTIFSMNPDGSGLKVNYSFLTGSTGRQPNGSLVLSNNLLYGVTRYGGVNSQGVIFSFDTTAGVYTKLYDFDGTNGSNPYEGLSGGPDGNVLYGITSSGGVNNEGVIFSFAPSSATYQKLYDMTDATGYYSYGPLTLYHDKFYGLTDYGGVNGGGVFFSFDPETNTYTDIYDYSAGSWDGYQSPGKMVVYNDVLYGVCAGGDNYNGQLFSYDDGGGGYKVLNDFTSGSLIEPSGIVLYNDMLYGVTYMDWNYYSGGVFSFNPNSGAYNELMTFGSLGDAYPSYGNIMVYNDKLLGIGNSSIYQVTPDGTCTDLQDFSSVQPPLGGYSNYGTLLLPVNDAPATGTTPQTISGMSNLSKNYGDTSFDPGAIASSGLKITYTSTDKNVARVSGSKIRIVGAGTCQVIAMQRGNTTYARVDDTVTLTVAKVPLLIKADNKTVNQLQPLPVLTVHYTGFVNGDTASSLTTQPAISATGDPSSSPQGTYDITVGGAVSPNYDISYQKGILTIVGQLQVLQLVDSATRNYGDPDFKLVFASNSGLPVTYSIDSADIATVSTSDTTKIHITGTGLTRVIARQPGNATWALNYDTVLLQVNKAPLAIVINDTSIVYGQPVPVFTCTYTGFVYNENASSAFSFGPVLTATSQKTPPYPGIYQIQIVDASIRNYNYTYVSGIFTVNPSGDSLNAYCSSPGLLAVNIMSAAVRKAVFNFYSLGGQRVLSSDLSLQKGLNQFSFPISSLSAGVYIVSVKGEAFKLSQKVALLH